LLENVALGNRLAVGEIHRARAGITLHHRAPRGIAARHARIHRKTVARDRDRRRQRGFQRQLAVVALEVDEGRGQAGDARRPRAVLGAVAVQLAVLGQVLRRRRCRGRGFACIDEDVLAGLRVVQQEEATAAEAGADRFHHREHCRHRDRGVERVAAFAQDLHAGVGGERVGGGDGGAGWFCGCLRDRRSRATGCVLGRRCRRE
jgi:hypothetical protein